MLLSRKKIMLNILLLILLTTFLINANPLSKINIVSKQAKLKREAESKLIFLTYKDDVLVTLNDNSKISTNILDITLSESCITANKPELDIQKIVLNGSVRVSQKKRILESEYAEIYPQRKTCKLIGNVKIEQFKKSKTDIAFTTKSNIANLNLENYELEFLGDRTNPVQTTIDLEGHPALKKLEFKKHEHNKNITARRSTKNSSW